MKYAVCLLSLALVACGGGGNKSTSSGATRFGSQGVTVLEGAVNSGASLSGSGAVLFEQDFGSFQTGKSYALDFALSDGGSVTLVSHGNSTLGGGWEMEFRRNGAGPGSLNVTLRASGLTRDTLDSAGHDVFSGMDASQPLKFQVDVHNNESPAAHSLTWSRALGEDFAEGQALLNTEENNNSPGKGNGTRWGLRLNNATVTTAVVSAPKFEE